MEKEVQKELGVNDRNEAPAFLKKLWNKHIYFSKRSYIDE